MKVTLNLSNEEHIKLVVFKYLRSQGFRVNGNIQIKVVADVESISKKYKVRSVNVNLEKNEE